MTASNAINNEHQVHRVMDTLVLPDLVEMEQTSQYNRDILLLMQDDLIKQVCQQGNLSDEVVNIDIVTKACAYYDREKKQGRGYDLRAYIKKATVYFNDEIGKHLKLLREQPTQLKEDISQGVAIRMEEYAERILISLVKISSLLEQAKPLFGEKVESLVQAAMNDAIGELRDVTDKNENKVGHEMLKMLTQLSKACCDTNKTRGGRYAPRPWSFIPKVRT